MTDARNTTMFLLLSIAGHLDPGWSDWFEGMNMRHLPDGTTEMSGLIGDQAAAYGLLNRARDLGLTLLAVSLTPDNKERPDSD
jgi:hypothetical protein